MPQQTKIFRVFISSTFSDMKEERNLLQEKVFPKLEKLCKKNNAKFQAVDLRWGVTEKSQMNQKTVEICLNEIARCQRISPKPNFLILLGDKYGWQPIPEKISVEEWNNFINKVPETDQPLLNNWYRKDENAVSAEYVLQQRTGKFEDYTEWEIVDNQIREILRNAVKQSTLNENQKTKYFTSATHQEIIDGALNPPSYLEDPQKHVFAFIRETGNMPKDQSAKDYIDFKNNYQDLFAKQQLSILKTELKQRLNDNYCNYPAKWQNGKTEIINSEDFCTNIFEKLKSVIESQLDEIADNDEIIHEQRLHKEFKDKSIEYFKGRSEILDKIDNYLADSSIKTPLALIGESGSGKSSVMAKAIEELIIKNHNAVISYRFLGTTSSSSNVISMMQSVAGQVAKNFGIELQDLAGEGNEKTLYDINGISEAFLKSIALATEVKPVTIFLDALDQLSETDNSSSLYWLPKELPGHVKIIVSSLPKLETYLFNTKIEYLPLLPEKEAKEILKGWLNSINRKLTDSQQNYTMANFIKTPLPIYLKLVFEQAKNWKSYQNHFYISDTVDGIINDFISNLEKEHPKGLVEHVICYMLCGRYSGLAENEILDILVFDEEFWEIFLNTSHKDHRQELEEAKKIPIAVWSRLFLDLEPFLTERDADGVPIITFFHRQFNEVLRKRYKLDEVKEVN